MPRSTGFLTEDDKDKMRDDRKRKVGLIALSKKYHCGVDTVRTICGEIVGSSIKNDVQKLDSRLAAIEDKLKTVITNFNSIIGQQNKKLDNLINSRQSRYTW